MLLVVGLHCSLEVGQSVVARLVNRHINLSRSGPEHNHAVHTLLLLEVADILAELLYHFPAGLAHHDVLAVKTLGVVVVESSLHRNDFLQLVLDRIDILLLEHLAVHGSLIGIDRIYIPCAELYIVQVSDGHNLVVFEILFVSAFANADFVVLSHRANRLGQPLAGHENTGHKGAGNSTETND